MERNLIMSGAPRSAYASEGEFVIVRRDAVIGLGDYTTAGVFQRIAWRAERDGGAYRATIKELAEELWLTEKQVRRCLAVLHERGWITSSQDAAYDRTATYEPVFEVPTIRPSGHMDLPKTPLPSAQKVTSSSIETYSVPNGTAELTAQTLIGEWIDHCVTRPPGRVVGQVSKEVGILLGENIPYATVRAGLGRWHSLSLHPSALASIVNEVLNPPTASRGRSPASAVQAGQSLIARLESQTQMIDQGAGS